MKDQLLAAVDDRIRRFIRTGDAQAVLAERAFLEAVELLPFIPQGEGGIDLRICHVLGWLFWCRYVAGEEEEESQDLSMALELFGPVWQADPAAVPEPAREHFENVAPFSAQAMGALREALDSADPRDLDAAIEQLREVVDAIPVDHPDWARLVCNLGFALEEKFERTDDVAALREAIDTGRVGVRATAADDPARPGRLSNLSNSLRHWATRMAEPSAVEEAIGLLRDAVATAPDSNPSKVGYAANLGSALQEHFEQTGDATVLAESATAFRFCVTATEDTDPGLPLYLAGLRDALVARFQHLADAEVLTEAVETCRRIEELAPADLDRPTNLNRLTTMLKARFEHTGNVRDLREAIDLGRQLVTVLADDPASRAAAGANLGSALQEWARHHGDQEAAEEAVAVVREALPVAPAADRPLLLNNLGNALQLLSTLNGELSALEEAVDVGRAAVAAVTGTGPPRAVYLSNLGNALSLWYDRTSELSALDEAVTAFRESIENTPAGHPDLVRRLANLSSTLMSRYLRAGEPRDLAEAVENARGAVGMLPRDHPFQTMYLTNLGVALLTTFRRTGERTALAEAEVCLRDVVRLSPEDSHSLPQRLSNLARLLLTRFEHSTDLDHADQAIAVFRHAVVTATADHPEYAGLLVGLGLALQQRHTHAGDPETAAEALRLFHEVAHMKTAAPDVRLDAGAGWGIVATAVGDPHSAVEGYAIALEMLPLVGSRHLAQHDAEYLLARLPGLASEAAACALSAGAPARAVTLLEQGRGVLLARAMETRTDLTDLMARDPRLAARFESLGRRLETAEDTPDGSRLRRELAVELDALVTHIRTLPGFERFLLPPTLSRLLAGTAGGPVVLVNVSEHRCDALILTPGGVRVRELTLTMAQARERTLAFLAALADVHDRARARERREQAQQTIVATLGWLWDELAEPVLSDLGLTSRPAGEWPRIWWSPTQFLSFLPLHAAGHHCGADARAVLDRVVSSYTPTVRALAQARAGQDRPPVPLVVAMPHTPGATDLPGARPETEIVTRKLPGTVVLTEDEATRDRILAALPAATWVHFACHATSSWENPSQSRLLAHDHATRPLTVLDISRLHLDAAELAYLSACHTARGGLRLADEALHLTTAFQLAGYRHVVGTLWAIVDQVAVEVSEGIYTILTTPGADAGRAPFAVHAATRALRDRFPDVPSLWARTSTPVRENRFTAW